VVRRRVRSLTWPFFFANLYHKKRCPINDRLQPPPWPQFRLLLVAVLLPLHPPNQVVLLREPPPSRPKRRGKCIVTNANHRRWTKTPHLEGPRDIEGPRDQDTSFLVDVLRFAAEKKYLGVCVLQRMTLLCRFSALARGPMIFIRRRRLLFVTGGSIPT
jgi:hypothetical protein